MIQGLLPNIQALSSGPGDNPLADEMKVLYNKKMPYDNLPASDIVRSVAQKTGINPALLFSSAFQEGMNKAIAKPDEVSEAYDNAKVPSDYPVDGFYNYGLDTFGDRAADLMNKGYLPKDFSSRYQVYEAKNEKGQTVHTAAFRTNQDALMAKAAFLKDLMDQVGSYAKGKNIPIDDNAQNYFTLAAYNSGGGNMQRMMDDYAKAKDKQAFLNGQNNWGSIQKNISPRLKNMLLAQQLLSQQSQGLSSALVPNLNNAGINQN